MKYKILFALILCVNTTVSAQWPMFRQNHKGTNKTTLQGPTSTAYFEWAKKLPYINFDSYAGAVIDNETIYIRSSDTLYCYNTTGEKVWAIEIKMGSNHESYPTIDDDGTLYIGKFPGSLCALYQDGTIKWTYNTNGTSIQTPIIYNESIFFTTNGKLYSVSKNGNYNWSAPTVGSNEVPVIDDQGNIYLTLGNGRVKSWDSQGNERWISEEYLWNEESFLTVVNNYLVGCSEEVIKGFDLNSGEEIWGKNLDDSPIVSAISTENNFLYAVTENGILYKISSGGNHNIIWEYELGCVYSSSSPNIFSTPIVDNSGNIFYVRINAECEFYDFSELFSISSSGQLNWKLRLDNCGVTEYFGGYYSPIIGPNKRLYCLTNSGFLYKIADHNILEEELNNSPWPMTFNNPQLTNSTEYPGPITAKVDWKLNLDHEIEQIILGDDDQLYISENKKFRAISSSGEVVWYGNYGSFWPMLLTNKGNLYGITKSNYNEDHVVAYSVDGGYLGILNDYSPFSHIYNGLNINNLLSQLLSSSKLSTQYTENYALTSFYPKLSIGWFSDFSDIGYSSPALDHNGDIFVVSDDFKLVKLTKFGYFDNEISLDFDPINSSHYWLCPPSIDSKGNVFLAISAMNIDTTIIYSYNNELNLRWKYSISDNYAKDGCPLTIFADSIIIFQSAQQNIFVLDDSGNFQWNLKSSSTVSRWEDYSLPVADIEGNIYFSQDENIRAVNIYGEQLWSIPIDSHISCGPIIGFNSNLYVGTSYGEVFCIGTCEEIAIDEQSSDADFCEGDVVQLFVKATGAYPINYQWYGPEGKINGETDSIFEIKNISGDMAGNYFCEINNPCDIKFTETVNISVIQLQTNEISGKDNVVVADTCIYSVEGQANSSFIWDVSDNGRILSSINPWQIMVKWVMEGSGNLYVEEISESGCSGGMSNKNVSINPIGVNELQENKILFFDYSRNRLLIDKQNFNSTTNLFLYNINGFKVNEYVIKPNSTGPTIINTSDLPKGVLIALYMYENQIISYKFINN